jgi:hypothetical protein
MTSVCQATPKRLDGVLNTAEDCSSLCRHVLDEDELASWLQNAPDLLESFALVVNRAQHRSRDDSICGLIGQIEGLRPTRTNIDIEAGGLGDAAQVRMHVPIGFYANPADVVRIVSEVGTCAGPDLDDCPMDAPQQRSLPLREKGIIVLCHVPHRPGEPALRKI